ncbi:MAG: ribonuclease N1 [Roseateles depolymerans]|uniref:Ribonuclease N1 n=1 Tax=Roseateles depolymerans TaxID=76731 RepID=A0A2W5DQG5_9BURK|nr:MAG: ribonuclease N1 [Roseateles depolymerans]
MYLLSWLARSSASAALAALLLTGFSPAAVAKEAAPNSPALAEVALSELPPEAQRTHQLVLAGGPFPYAKDGVVFGNRERLLPRQARGFYREYTVKTPGSRDRGARRLVCGGKPPTAPEACYYTDDHYASFKRIRAAAGR